MRTALRLVAAVLPALALPAQDPGFTGAWKYASDSGIATAIEDVVKDMNFIKRPIARGRLKDGNPAYQKVTFAAGAQEISIQYDARNPIKMPADGKAVPWTREDGQKFQVSARIDGSKLTQTFKNDEVERTNTWTLGADRKLTLAVHLKSASLPKPLVYTISFAP